MSRLAVMLTAIACLVVVFASGEAPDSLAAESRGVTARLDDGRGSATIHVKSIGRYQVQIDVDPKAETKPLVIRVELPVSGPKAWPVAAVEVFDAKGRPLPVRHVGTEWHRLFITLPAEPSTLTVRAADPVGNSRVPPERERRAMDPKTGLTATICRWHDGRRAALSIRFDDSHPTHLSKAIPILDAYGFRGTFMVNPGAPDGRSPNPRWRSAFQDHLEKWKAVARSGRHEFANHTLHHRGAMNDEEMERQIGDAAKAIWKLFPQKSKLMALNLGGGTQWTTTKPLQYYLDKYHLFDASANSTGMDDSYGNRVATFRRLLESHIQRGLWYRVHYHSIGNGFASSEANFRAVLDIAKEHEDELWIAGMADIHKYQTERRSAKLAIESSSPSRVSLRLACSTSPELFDQPLTIEVGLPESWAPDHVEVKDDKGQALTTHAVQTIGHAVLRFDVPPRNSRYWIEMLP